MFGLFKKLFDRPDEKALLEAIKNGAILVDVRNAEEVLTGNIKGSINIPLDKIRNGIGKLKKNRTIIVFCASGIRSSRAKSILEENGFQQVINGGSWRRVASIIENNR
ncbi:MAG TPA: rhodanese-like domain-containing protein [Arenibacter sp.]|nr:rhodanese-like domain-containing protein [Arenibacter sp.]